MNRENFKTVILTILVATSVFLSYRLWTYQAVIETIQGTGDLQNVTMLNQREVGEVVKPLYMVYHTDDTQAKSRNARDLQGILKILSSGRIENLHDLSGEMSHEEMVDLITANGKIEMIYPTDLTLYMLQDVFTMEVNGYGDLRINRIVLNTNEHEEELDTIYLVSLEQGVLLEATLANTTYHRLQDVSEDFSDEFVEVMKQPLPNKEVVYLPVETVTMQKKEMLAEMMNMDILKQSLFTTTSSLREETDGTVVFFTDAIRLLTVDTATGEMTFQDPLTEQEEEIEVDNDLLKQSVDFTNTHNGWTNSFFLDSWDEVTNEVRFRLEEHGFPVFGGGVMTQRWANERILLYQRSHYVFDEFLHRSKEGQVELPPGPKVVEAVKKSTRFNWTHVQDIFLAYEMEFAQDAASEFALQYLQFVPVWVIQHNNMYYRLDIDKDGRIGGDTIGLE